MGFGTKALRAGLAAGLAVAVAGSAVAQTPSPVSRAVQEARRHMLDAEVNTLTFHNMDELFTTRTVGRAGPVWTLPKTEQPLAFSYAYEGKTYAAEDVLERTYTNALLVMKDGRIVYERYLNNTGPDTRFIAWSMTKSLVSMLVGIAVSEGRIKSIDEPITAYLPELKGGGYDGTSIRAIMEMRSGVDYEERYDFANPSTAQKNHESSLVQNVTRFADAARTIKQIHKPGEVFAYKTLDTAVLGWLVERAVGTNVSSYMASRLWEPLGAEQPGFFIMDGLPGVGREFTGAGFNATLRDFARIGLMVLNDGRGPNGQIVPAAWLRESTRPSHPEGPTGGYGLQWWTAPNSDAFYALGLQGQFIYVDRPSRTVVVKTSFFPPGDTKATPEALAFMAAAAAWKPR
jgi:CubicO group peptidase (beta-lactamase class C family)